MRRGTTHPSEIVAAMGGHPPTDEQWSAIAWPLEPFVLVAGAGSGKTSVMAARVVYLALAATGRIDAGHAGVLPGNVLCLTFTKKATDNLRHRVAQALSGLELADGDEPEIVNYHAFAAGLLERNGMLVGIEPGQRVLTPAQRTELCGRVLDLMTFEHVRSERLPTVVDQILTLDDQATNHRVTPDEIVAFCEARLEALANVRSSRPFAAATERIELARGVRLFRQLKRDLGLIDFGDQIELALQIVERHPEVAEGYRQRFGAVLLDEYQDTDITQARLLATIFGDGHPVTAVGDPDQNIYAWRGANLYNLLEFPERFPRSDGSPSARLPLYTNFRSGATVLEAADVIIGQLPAAQRPDPEKRLVPWPANGDGEVTVARISDEWREAEWIADHLEALHRAGSRWADCAVLCRTSRLFFSIQQAFGERGIPVEIVGLAGLLRMPAVVEVLAYARAVNDPFASIDLARILLGPRYRIGFTDVARVAALAKTRNVSMRAWDEDEGEPVPFLFAEALEHLDEVDGLSREGRERLEECRRELRELRAVAGRPVAEFLGEIIRRTGLLAELDAHLDERLAAGIKRNLAAFLDEVHAFEPIEGELTLRAFLDYLETVERLDKPEWSPVQPSDEDSVKVMTIHTAKGLEFDNVFVPGLAKGLLPNMTIQQNPAERGKSLDFELRGDAAILPTFDGVLARFRDELKRQELYEERRTAYVAMTRARRRLFVTGAHWYGETIRAKEGSEFLKELASWAQEARTAAGEPKASWDPGAEIDEDANPLRGYRERFVKDWPEPARPDESDGLFPHGWRREALAASGSGGVQPSLSEVLDPLERERFEALAAERRHHAAFLLEREAAEGGASGSDPAPASVSASGVIDHARCPRRFYWSHVRPLPRFSGPAARIGTEVHRWIERHAGGQATLIDLEEAPDLTYEELAGEPGKLERLRRAFLASRFADSSPLYTERPFLLRFGRFTVGGRIDAVFGEPDGPWEIVDWKTGRPPRADDPVAGLQLDVYGLACAEIWGKRAEDLTLTYLYLASGDEVSHPMGDPRDVRARIGETLAEIEAGRFEPTPGPPCTYCDFRAFCEPGKAWVSAREGASGAPD
ncbi:MAG: ATP-dependent DNA helicase [Actinomycetota bacterium]